MTSQQRPAVFVMEAQTKAALPIIQSLGCRGLRVVAGSSKRLSTGFFSRFCDERHIYPSPRDHTSDFQQWLLDFLRRRKIEMIFPVGGDGTAAVSAIQDEVRRHTLLLLPDDSVFRIGYAKISTLKTAAAAGVPIPDTWYPRDQPGGLDDVLPRIKSWPVLIKPSIGSGARGIIWCHDSDEVRRRFPEIEDEHGESFLQDFVPSAPHKTQYKVDMLVDADQRRLAGVVYGKTRMYPPDGGSSVLNFSADRPDILDHAHSMLVRMKWVGFCDFDFVDDPRDDVPKLMEINPRFPESFRMGPSVGIDFPMMMYDLAHGEAVAPIADYPKNRFLRFLPGDLLWFVRVDNKRRFSTWPSWFRFFGARTTYQVCSLSDPGPIIGYMLENIAMALGSGFWSERARWSSGPRGRRD